MLAVFGILVFYLFVTGLAIFLISKNGPYLSVSESAQFPGAFLLQNLAVLLRRFCSWRLARSA